jgi:hypothetical protein
MSEIDFRELCKLLSGKLSQAFIERIERRLGQDFAEALEKKPNELLTNILQDIHMYYVSPYEMAIELSEYLGEVHGISKFSLSFSENYDFPLSEKVVSPGASSGALWYCFSLFFSYVFSDGVEV